MEIRGRIAPTPSGFLHYGNLYSFLLTYIIVKSLDGKLMLRIDDADETRFRNEYLSDIFFVLEKYGISYDIGPAGPDDFKKNWSQKLRFNAYHEFINKLIDKKQTFDCSCSRKMLHNLDSLHKIKCISKSDNQSVRISVNKNSIIKIPQIIDTLHIHLYNELGNFIIKQNNGIPSSIICSLADDILFNINTIIRGNDLINFTGAQLYLSSFDETYQNFIACNFLHHPLLVDKSLNKLSKSVLKQKKSEISKSWVLNNIFPIIRKNLGIESPTPYLSEMIYLVKYKMKQQGVKFPIFIR